MQVIDPDLEGGFAGRPTIPKKTLTSNFFYLDDDDLRSGLVSKRQSISLQTVFFSSTLTRVILGSNRLQGYKSSSIDILDRDSRLGGGQKKLPPANQADLGHL